LMARTYFAHQDFLDAALAIAAERGPPAATVGSITQLLKAPTGSFYHRFSSRGALLGELWVRTVLAFQDGARDASESGDWLGLALHTPRWVRGHIDEARLLLLYHRDDFLKDEWPQALREAVAAQAQGTKASHQKCAAELFGELTPETLRRAQYILAEA